MTTDEKIRYLLEKKSYGFDDLVLLVEVLRSDKGCPWDREQDHKSIRKDLIEETYEVVEAIDTENPTLLREELGDVLLQVVFHAQIEREAERFTMDDVANDICVKLIHRHPHVFGEVSADTSDKVLSNWEKIKSEEKHRNTITDKLKAITPMLPALMLPEIRAPVLSRTEAAGRTVKCGGAGHLLKTPVRSQRLFIGLRVVIPLRDDAAFLNANHAVNIRALRVDCDVRAQPAPW